jgi:hypothetical protein
VLTVPYDLGQSDLLWKLYGTCADESHRNATDSVETRRRGQNVQLLALQTAEKTRDTPQEITVERAKRCRGDSRRTGLDGMAPHLAGTSPASRSATPTPPLSRNSSNAAAGPRRSSIVPFTRPTPSGTSDDGGQGSFKSSEDALQRISHSLQQRRTSSSASQGRESTSFGDNSTSLNGLRRPEPRMSGQFARGSGFVRKEGFQTEQFVGNEGVGQRISPRPPVSPHGLLSRQFSSDCLQPAVEQQNSTSEALKVCF